MPKRTALDWEDLERELHAAGVSPEEINAGARRLLAQARGHQLADTRKQLGLGQKQIAAAMGVSVARVSQIEHGEVTSFEVIARYVEALGGRLDLVADFGDRTVRLPVSDTATAALQQPRDSPAHRARGSRSVCMPASQTHKSACRTNGAPGWGQAWRLGSWCLPQNFLFTQRDQSLLVSADMRGVAARGRSGVRRAGRGGSPGSGRVPPAVPGRWARAGGVRARR